METRGKSLAREFKRPWWEMVPIAQDFDNDNPIAALKQRVFRRIAKVPEPGRPFFDKLRGELLAVNPDEAPGSPRA